MKTNTTRLECLSSNKEETLVKQARGVWLAIVILLDLIATSKYASAPIPLLFSSFITAKIFAVMYVWTSFRRCNVTVVLRHALIYVLFHDCLYS